MRQSCRFRTLALCQIALVSAVAVTFLLSRSSTNNSLQALPSHRNAVQYQSIHPKRQTPDQDGGLDFSFMTRTSPIVPPPTSLLCRSCTDEPLLSFQINRYHHNRPPPLI
jgi:hypothetical protein